MKKIIAGIVAFIIITGGALIYNHINEPASLTAEKSIVTEEESTPIEEPAATSTTDIKKAEPVPSPEPTPVSSLLTKEQEETLEKFGIDTDTIPSEITPEQEACAIEEIGIDRVEDIKNGDAPSLLEMVAAMKCI